jgi:hypothetical protein
VAKVIAPAVPKEAKPAVVALPSGTNDYLLAHQAFSPRMSLVGMAPYVRTSRAGSRGAAVRTRALGAALVLATSVAHAQSPENWLRKMHLATQKLSYVGTFVYQNADRTRLRALPASPPATSRSWR